MKKFILLFVCLFLFGCENKDINYKNPDNNKKDFRLEINEEKVSNRNINEGIKLSTEFKEINVIFDSNKYTLEEALEKEIITINDIKENMILVDTLVDCTKVYKSTNDFSNIEFYLYDCWQLHISNDLTDSCPIANVTPIEGC